MTRSDDGNTAIERCDVGHLFVAHVDRQTDVDDGCQVVVGKAVEEHSAVVVVGAAERHVAGLQRVPANRIAYPGIDRHDAYAEPKLGNLAGDNLDFRPHGVGVRLTRAVKAIEIRLVHDVVVEQHDLADAQPRQQHGDSASGAAAADDADAQLAQIAVQGLAKCEGLPVERAHVQRCGPVGIVQGDARAENADNRQRFMAALGRVQPDAPRHLAVGRKYDAQNTRAITVSVQRALQQVGLVGVILRGKRKQTGGMAMHHGDDLIAAGGLLERLNKGARAP